MLCDLMVAHLTMPVQMNSASISYSTICDIANGVNCSSRTRARVAAAPAPGASAKSVNIGLIIGVVAGGVVGLVVLLGAVYLGYRRLQARKVSALRAWR